jgi:hypothetical protein
MTLPSRAAVGDDLALLSASPHSNESQSVYFYRVLTPVLSDLGFFPGQVLTMRALADNETPEAFAIVAVSAGGALLLRQFVPPRLLIANSRAALIPMISLAADVIIVAVLDGENLRAQTA